MTINTTTRTITLTRKEMTAASHFGTTEYKNLQEVRRDYPGFQVNVAHRNVNSKRETYKGLTYEYMERYIKFHDENGTVMAEFNKLRGKSDDTTIEMPTKYTYKQMREWFLKKYEEIAKFYEECA